MAKNTDQLNADQLAAVRYDAGPLIVLAGPGTGKTRVIVHRVAHMIQEREIAPERIVAVTYTTKAAAQMRERLAKLVGADADRINTFTFHGFGYRLVRRFADVADLPRPSLDTGGIVDTAQQTRLLREIILDHKLFPHARALGVDAVVQQVSADMATLENSAVSVEQCRTFAERASAALSAGTNVLGEPLDQEGMDAERERVETLSQTARAIELFALQCRKRGWLTYGDLIGLPIHILTTSARAAAIIRDEYRHIVVDEFQDANTAQIELLRMLAPPERKPDLCVVGDDDQSIYNFRGADDLAFKRFAETWSDQRTIKLAANFRSTPPIITVSNAIMAEAETRFAPDKVIVPGRKPEAPPPPVELVHLENDAQDAEVIASMILLDRSSSALFQRPFSSYAVVARSNSNLETIRTTLQIEGIPSVIRRSGSILQDEGVQDALAWVRVLCDPHDIHHAVRLLTRAPNLVDLRVLQPLAARYRAELSRFDAGEPGSADPGAFMDWLEVRAADQLAIRNVVHLYTELRSFAAGKSAMDVIFRIVTAADLAHADLLPGPERASRVAALVSLVRFARNRQNRLEAPGDLRAFQAYYDDLSADDLRDVDTEPSDRVDGGSESEQSEGGEDAVQLITAHSAKGLEFDTVFVPRISPRGGFGKVRSEDRNEFPAGLVAAEGTPRQRAQAEMRRMFYVACTRAQRRLVLLSKRNKNPSQSTHYFEELKFNDGLRNVVQVKEGVEYIAEAARRSLGKSRFGVSIALDVEQPNFAFRRERQEMFDRAKRDLRLSAAGALERAGGESDPAESITELERVARRLAAVRHAERTGEIPAWAKSTDAGRFAGEALARAGKAELFQEHSAPRRDTLHAPLQLSYTFISDYRRCPRCFYLKHVLGLDPIPETPMVSGSVIHQALQQFYEEWRLADMDGSAKPSAERLLDIGRRAFFARWPRHQETQRAVLDQVLAQLALTIRRLHDPDANVLEIEKLVQFPYGKHTFHSKIDRIDQIETTEGQAFRIVDYKSGLSTKALREPSPSDLQLGIYAMALNHMYGSGDPDPAKLVGVAEYWILSEGAKGTIALSAIRYEKVRQEIDEVIAGVLAADFPRKDDDKAHECDILGPDEDATGLGSDA